MSEEKTVGQESGENVVRLAKPVHKGIAHILFSRLFLVIVEF